MKKIVSVLHFFVLLLLPLLSLAQRDLPVGERFYGTWVKKDSGIVISEEGIKQVYKDEGRWLQGGFSKGRSYYADTTVRSAEKVWEGWDISYYTYLREYLTNGTEQSIEAIDIRRIKMELINETTLRLSYSKPFTIKEANRHPAPIIPNELKKSTVFSYAAVLKKIN